MEKILEYFGTITGLIYIVLEIKQHRVMWIVGVVTSLVYAFVFLFAKFYAGMGLNVYYVMISVYGYWQWSRQHEDIQDKNSSIIYRRLNKSTAFGVVAVAAALFGGIYYILLHTDSPVALGDAFLTALNIVGTWMLARRIIEHWGCWLIVEVFSTWIYFKQGLYPTSFLYACYTIMVFVGFYIWIKNGTQTKDL